MFRLKSAARRAPAALLRKVLPMKASRPRRAPALAVALLAGLSAFAATDAAFAQGVVKSVSGDWQLRCDTMPGAQTEQCAMTQAVAAADKEYVGLSVFVLKTADKRANILRVLAPLGVLLPYGLGLHIDNEDLGRAAFVRCLPNGCMAEVTLDENLLSKMRGGKEALFSIFETPEEGIGIPVSLKGFGKGFDSLP
ncbi:Invasion protein IalB, involved in pathogenesis [Pseudoxanthobacter soli DSM 19599]|uniref:Invasion protein IalB, involved in pathogenesis n=2 Tax=Pseudoxanthobacter TaxID=433838 RepID=A0A1M7Z570_9HYPH|nr:Invasion protein IalB, involved in pathogenesis [Pseudoxanthobacter soli DSM 19599]